jgi:hypothetical protein
MSVDDLLERSKVAAMRLVGWPHDKKRLRLLTEVIWENKKHEKGERVMLPGHEAKRLWLGQKAEILSGGLCDVFTREDDREGPLVYKLWNPDLGWKRTVYDSVQLKVRILRNVGLVPGLDLPVGTICYLPWALIRKTSYRLEASGDVSAPRHTLEIMTEARE